MYNVDIKILDKRLEYDTSFLKYQTSGSSALDLQAMIYKNITVYPNQVILLPSGLAIFISNPLITAIIVPRSGLGHNYGIILGNTIGLIDSDYQGELMISIWNRSLKKFYIKPGDRIAQLLFVPIIKPNFNVVSNFPLTTRNKSGFGHSGV
ncbi:Deoxyuridine 5'-triphosphate nucleotidohydrolase [Buchnera aphidicola (Takecallis arundicolens)]|uniref:dUTP diphosphatase n=1 Tax=Buchnera aphidicola TaxID=9 RepID=UPI00346461A9